MLKKSLQKYFGFNSFLKGQEEVIRKVLERQSVAAIFPTGAGKSLCYQLPAILLPGMTLVVSPLLSLMKDQLDFLLESNIPAARLDSTLQKNEYNAILERAKNNELKIMKDGKIYSGKELLGEIMIMNPKDPSTLQRGSNLNFYSDTENYQSVKSESYKIFQGYLENSNVNAIAEMQAMISTNSDYQSSYKIITYLDKSLEKANEIGKV